MIFYAKLSFVTMIQAMYHLPNKLVSPAESPLFHCLHCGENVYFILDTPHLMKSTRNNMMATEFIVSAL